MQHFYKIILLFIFFANSIAYSKNTHILDKNESYLITEINITGNKITKATVIFRELSFKKNDLITIDEIDSKIQSSRYNLTNLNLFNFIQECFKVIYYIFKLVVWRFFSKFGL